ncbi:MAG: ABC transporter ATP-binding protein [Armatimonadota bacterium]|nr:ABC transporter ATP-binding protein [Armatimonadota bacterium]
MSGAAGRGDPVCLELAELSRHFGGLRAVDSVNLTVAAGERRAIIGPNGAGKTTLFNLISGELTPTSGRILLFGQDVTRLPPYRRAALGLGRTYQIMNLFPGLTVLENVLLAVQGLRAMKNSVHRAVDAYPELFAMAQNLLERVEMWEKRHLSIGSLSYGEQRQVELLLALAGHPRLLLLDEPTAGLAPAEARLVTQFVRALDPATTVLLIEHDMDVAFEVADRVTVLHFGQVLADGPKEEIRRDPEVQRIYLGT